MYMYQFKVMIDDIQERVKVPKGIRMLLRRCCKAVMFEENREDFWNVKIVFTDNRTLSELSGNNIVHEEQELFVRKPVGALSENSDQLGEIYISLESALHQSQIFNNSLEAEIVFLTAHGLLLLLGYKNNTAFEKDTVQDKENRIIHNLGIKYQNHDV